MSRRLIVGLVLALGVLSAASLAAAEGSAAAVDPLGQNAALKYWLAFGLMRNLDLKQDDAIRESIVKLGPVDSKVAQLLEGNEAALKELRRGARLPRCVWGLSLEDGGDMGLPHAWRARQLGQLACLRARLSFERGDSGEAIRDLLAAMTLGRHLGQTALAIPVVAGWSIEHHAIRVAAGYLNKLDARQLQEFSTQLDRLPVLTTSREIVLTEKQVYLDWFIAGVSRPDGKERLMHMVGKVDEATEKSLKALSEEQLREAAVGLRPVYDKLAEIAQLPPAEVRKAEKELLCEGNLPAHMLLLAKLMPPAATAIRQNEVNYLTRFAMLRAAVAVEREGPAVLSAAAHRDPFGDGPFHYAKLNGGFRLLSKALGPDGKPISLAIGRAPPE